MVPKSVWRSLARSGWHFSPDRLAAVGHAQIGLAVQRLEQRPPILEEGLAQTQLDGLQVGDPVEGEVLADHVQEGGGFLELGGDDLLGLEFFFTVRALVLKAGQLVAEGDVVFGQGLEAAVVVHVLLDLGGLVLRDALGELFAAKESLEDIIRAAAGGGPVGRLEELLAQGSAAEAVDGLQWLEESLLFLAEGVEGWVHG